MGGGYGEIIKRKRKYKEDIYTPVAMVIRHDLYRKKKFFRGYVVTNDIRQAQHNNNSNNNKTISAY